MNENQKLHTKILLRERPSTALIQNSAMQYSKPRLTEWGTHGGTAYSSCLDLFCLS
ncbi:hypothetical protein T07_8952 [Trichinella nelsoni]|uniref:Uncharacterized protein n=1 Tax=Trichinella nelsoni TaxID=6336 RepID=A0A0V0RD65_9BILA|nr:hypothetical protein T07_8952 [Trichinella nelsoni]